MQVDQIARQRFESFKMPSSTISAAPRHNHTRSHSRNASISSTASLPTPLCTTIHEIAPAHPHSLPPPKRNSHHRRRSSVSTRRESAEMMGVSVSDPSLSPAEDATEKDSLRRHALWALEGKRDASFSKVEIPELPTPFEFPTKPSFPPGSGTFMNTAKRDSFKPSLSKDCLGTLVEEEEEEEDSDKPRAPPTPTTPTTLPARPINARPRPPHLRPLSLTPDNLPSHNLPTPSSPKRSSLKVLALAADVAVPNAIAPSPTPNRSRPVLNIKLSTESSLARVSDHPQESSGRPKSLRKSSISYKTSAPNVNTGLPTPETTPTCVERRFSGYSHSSISSRSSLSSTTSSNRPDDDFISTSIANRPLSASEQHFLFKSHNALLARITDLERALSVRNNASYTRERGSRPSSVASAASSHLEERSDEPLNEMVSLVTDLKAERDELKRDVEGWRVRVADLEKQLTVFTNRVEVERREAWVARTRVGLLEVERSGLEKRVGELETENQRLLNGEEELSRQVARLLEEKAKMSAELQEAKSQMAREVDPLSTPRVFDGPVVVIKPVVSSMKRGLGFTSLDSQSSATDVEDGGIQSFGLGFKLRAVEEEDPDDNEENGLAGYEDEDEDDVLLSPSSSFGSVEDFYPKRAALDIPAHSPSVPQPSVTATTPHSTNGAHANRFSISKWTFPKYVAPKDECTEPEVDRFFGCLEDLDDPPSPNSPNYSEYDEEKSKDLFAKGFSCGDAKSCFVLPASVLASAEASFVLDAVEEEEEETEGETVVDGEVNHGIKITFTPPAEDRALESLLPDSFSPSKQPIPTLAFFEEDDGVEEEVHIRFNCPRSVTSEVAVPSTPPPVAESRTDCPSSIPRPKKSAPSNSSPRPASPAAFVTPPTKRGGAMPSFIPQPYSPSRINPQKGTPPFSSNASTKPSTTFIRQPPRQPLLPNSHRNPAKTQQVNADTAPHVSPRYAANATARPGSNINSFDTSDGDIPTGSTPNPSAACNSTSPSVLSSSSFSSIMSSPLAGRLSFQTLTNYIPSWGMTSPRSAPNVAEGHDRRPVAPPAGTVKRGFVSKQSQLERLKTRLERETVESRGVVVKKSDDDAIFL